VTAQTVSLEPETALEKQPTQPPAGRSSTASRLAVIGPPLITIVVIVMVWEALTASGRINKLILPTPFAVLSAFGHDASNLGHNAWHTTVEAVLGFTIGNLFAVALAIAFVHSDLTRRVVYPLALAAQAVPIVAAAPALVLWLGNGMQPKIFVAAFLVFFPTVVNMIRGLRSADADVEELFHSLSAGRWQRLVKIRLPASLPYLFTALKLAACSCFVGAIVAEWIGSNHGLGYLIVFDSSQFKTAEMWAAVILGSVLSMIMYRLVVTAERFGTPWLPKDRDEAS
jgi:ABC-type nitrate/sulfonate/bicarbonate transport system permease component